MALATAYTLQHDHEMMQSHVAASVLDAKNGFAALQTRSAANILLAIGNDGVMRSLTAAGASIDGWTTLDLSSLAGFGYDKVDDETAKLFAKSYNASENTLTVLVAMSAKDQPDKVFSVTGPADTDPAQWITSAASVAVTPLPFDADPSTFPAGVTVTAETLSCHGLFAEGGLESTDDQLLIAFVEDADDPATLRGFYFDLTAKPVWRYFDQEQPIKTDGTLAITPGAAQFGAPMGVYKLYDNLGSLQLSFKSFTVNGGQSDAVMYEAPEGAVAISELLFQVKGPRSQTGSDLFVAAKDGLYLFPFRSLQNAEGIRLISDARFADTTQLHMVNAGDTVVMWGVNKSGNVYYSYADIGSYRDASAWSPLLILANDAMAVAGVQGTPYSELDLFVFGALSDTATAKAQTDGLARMTRDSVTGHWNRSHVAVPGTVDAIVLKTYGTRLLLTDANNVPCSNVELTISPTTDVPLLLNGKAVTVKAGQSFSVCTDGTGTADIVQVVSTVVGTRFVVTVPGQAAVTIDPSSDTKTTLNGIKSGSDLNNVSYTDATGKNKSLVAQDKADQAGDAAGAISILTGKVSGLPYAGPGNAASLRSRGRPSGVALGDGVLDEIGDLIEATLNSIEDIGKILFEDVRDGIQITINFVDSAISAVAQTVEDVYGVITAVLKKIGAFFEDVFEWLAFLFQWNTFCDVADILEGYIKDILKSVPSAAKAIDANVAVWTTSLQARIADASSVTGAMPSSSGSAAWAAHQPASYQTPGGKDMRSDPKIGWMKSRSQDATSGTPVKPAGHPAALAIGKLVDGGDVFDSVAADAEKIFGDLTDLIEAIEDDIEDFAKGTIDTDIFFTKLLAAVESEGLTVGQQLIDTATQAIVDLESDIEGLLKYQIDIPVISAFYDKIRGEPLTVLSFLSLLFGIIFAIFYKIATNQDPVAALKSSSLGTDLPKVLSTVAGIIAQPAGAAQLDGDRTSDRALPATARRGGKPLDVGDYLTCFGGVLHGVLILVLGGIEIAEAAASTTAADAEEASPPPVNWIYFADLLCRILLLSVEVSEVEDSEAASAKLKGAELYLACAYALVTLAGISKAESGDNWGDGLRKIDGVTAFILGILSLIVIAENCDDAEQAEIFSASVEVGELIQMFLIALLDKADPVDKTDLSASAAVVLGLRGLGAIGAGLLALDKN